MTSLPGIINQRIRFVGQPTKLTYIGTFTALSSSGGLVVPTSGALNIGNPSADRLVVCTLTKLSSSAAGYGMVGVSFNGLSGVIHAQQKALVNPGNIAAIASCLVPHDRLCQVVWTGSGSDTGVGAMNLWTITGLASQGPIDANAAGGATDISETFNLKTRLGGFIIGAGTNNVQTSNSSAWSGGVSYTMQTDASAGGRATSMNSTAATVDSASCAVTLTDALAATAQMSMAAVSW